MKQIPAWLDVEPNWVSVLPVNPIPKILKEAHVATGLRLLALLGDRADLKEQPMVRDLHQMTYKSLEVARIIRRQRDDGTWPIKAGASDEASGKQLILLSLVENLHALEILGGSRHWPSVRKGLTAVLGYQQDDGRFPLLYHHHAVIGRLLIELGLIRNPAVHKAAHWILERQRDDGGWLHPQMASKRKNPPSCIWTTAEVLGFLTRYQTFRIKERLQAAGEFLLAHALKPNTTTLLPDANSWNILSIGSQGVHLFQGGTLKVLDGLSRAGLNPSNSGFKKLYNWLLEQQLDKGYFPRIVGMDTEGDPLVTVRALAVIQRIESTRPEQIPDKEAVSRS